MPADANRVELVLGAQTGFGSVSDATGETLRITGESLGADAGFTSSQELRTDRQVGGRVRNAVSASGDINFELSVLSFDTIWEAALLSAGSLGANTPYTTAAVAMTQTAGSGGTGKFKLDANSFNAAPQPYDWFRVIGGANDGKYFKVASVSGGGNGDEITVASGDVEAESGASVQLVGLSSIVNGTSVTFYTLDKIYRDLTNNIERILDLVFEGVNLSVSADSIVTGSFNTIAGNAVNATTPFAASPQAATTTEVLNAISDVKAVHFDGAESPDDQVSFSLALVNNYRPRNKIGQVGAFSIGTGTIDVSGSLQAFYERPEFFQYFLDDTPFPLAYIWEDQDGNGLVIDIPQNKFTSGRRVAGGINTDVIADLAYGSYRDPVEEVTIRVAQYTAPTT